MLFTALKTVLIILEVLLIFNLMIIVHELGHFLAARWRGLVIEKFGIWFGKPLWKKTIGGVEYSLGSIPAGGFVALPQLAPMEVMEGKVETSRDKLPPISALDKIIVAFAGPLFSFGLAFVFALIVWKAGRPVGDAESSTVVGEVAKASPADRAGILAGDRILRIDGHEVHRFGGMGTDSIIWRIVRSEGASINVELDRAGAILTKQPEPFVPDKRNWWNRKSLRQIGIYPAMTALVADVTPGTPAAAAGLQKGDVISGVNGAKLFGPSDLYDYAAEHPQTPYQLTVRRGDTEQTLTFDPSGIKIGAVEKDSPAAAAGLKAGDLITAVDTEKAIVAGQLIKYVGTKAGVPLTLHIARDGVAQEVKVTPQVPVMPPAVEKQVNELKTELAAATDEKAKTAIQSRIDEASVFKAAKIGMVLEENDGFRFEPEGFTRIVHPGPVEQLRAGVMSIVNTLDAVIFGKSGISVQHMGGPVMMMNAYYHFLVSPDGWRRALWFSVVLNVNLALLNLLPIPVLDGGHITLAIVEAIRRKPVNVRFLEFVQTACALTIIGFMVFIAFFDVQDLPFFGEKSSGIKFQKPTPIEVTK